MIEDLSIEEFCAYWVPKLQGVKPEEWGYRQACVDLLVKITDYSRNTCANWVYKANKNQKPPRMLYKLLRLAHKDLLNQENNGISLENLKKELKNPSK